MAKHRTRVGLHARNSVHFTEHDYELVRLARIEMMKMMSQTDISVYDRLRRENPKIEFIVRLYDDRLRHDSRPSPADFVAKMVPIIKGLKRFVRKFEIHNEPNHVDGVEAWGSSDQHARSFLNWYMQVLSALKQAVPWAKFGFPGLALNHPHRDLEWLEICKDAIRASDWLGCHCYWQYGNMMKDEWGLRFKLYHERFPNFKIEITEFGDSTPNRPREDIARQYVQYYQELNKYPYLRSASAFIASSPDPTWNLFVWMKEGGEMLPVVRAVGNMKRRAVEVVEQPTTTVTKPDEAGRKFPQTGKMVRGSFLEFFDQYGLDICGYPITDQIEEAGLPAQYFQRLALEEYQAGKVRLKLVGTEAWRSREQLADLKARLESIQKHPSAGGSIKPAIQDITDELPKHASEQYPSRSLSDINQIVIHHTGTSPTITPQRLAEYQVQRLKKAAITYHFVVAADGTLYQTNRLETVSDHAFARNQGSVGVCFPGNFTNAIPTTAQLEAGGQLCAWLLSHLRLSTDSIVGLGEFVNTQSPGKQWLRGQRWKDKLLAEVESAIEAVGEDQSVLIASLREQIEALQDEIERLTTEGAEVEPSATPIESVVDRLSNTTVTLQAQLNVLQGERAKLEALEQASDKEQAALITSLRKQIKNLQNEKDQLQAEMEVALKAKGDQQANLIASLRSQINSLQSEIRRLQELTPTQPTTPVVVGPAAGVSAPAIQNMVDKLPRHNSKQYGNRPRSDIQTLVIHHSAVPPTVGPKRIAEYHVNSLDWPGVGYHFLVADDGVIYQGNQVTTVSFHAAKVNPRGVGICFLGNFSKEVPPPAQLQSGAHLVAWLMQELDLELDLVKGHQEFMATACPGNQWLRGKKWKQMLRQQVLNVQQAGTQAGLSLGPVAGAKPIYHYVLFWHHGDSWAKRDWENAQDYIAAFQPTVGFSSQDAAQAQYVTIIGGPLGVPQNIENWLVSQGCRIDRIAGANEAATKQMLTNLVNKGKRFRSFDE